MSLSAFHPRNVQKTVTDEGELLALLNTAPFVTLALCHANEPYLVTVNYTLDIQERCLYIHCAAEGKKLDILRTNPRVWGQAMEDNGYVAGRCTYAYRSVHFLGEAEIVTDRNIAWTALCALITRYERADAAAVIARYAEKMAEPGRWERLAIVRIRLLGLSGKRSPV
jgi:uncharacterized protein